VLTGELRTLTSAAACAASQLSKEGKGMSAIMEQSQKLT